VLLCKNKGIAVKPSFTLALSAAIPSGHHNFIFNRHALSTWLRIRACSPHIYIHTAAKREQDKPCCEKQGGLKKKTSFLIDLLDSIKYVLSLTTGKYQRQALGLGYYEKSKMAM
jgi:hypothetical protein